MSGLEEIHFNIVSPSLLWACNVWFVPSLYTKFSLHIGRCDDQRGVQCLWAEVTHNKSEISFLTTLQTTCPAS